MRPDIRNALEVALLAMPSCLPTAFENMVFDPPVDETGSLPYQDCNFMTAPPLNTVLGNGMFQERGIMQVSLKYPSGVGSGDADAMALALQAYFYRGQTFVSGSVKVNMDTTPQIGTGRAVGDRWMIPVSIQYFAFIIN